MNKKIITTALALCTCLPAMTYSSPALAVKSPRNGTADARIKKIRYDADQVYSVNTHYGFSTLMIFEEGEIIESVDIGDADAWQVLIINRGNIISLKPEEPNADTNMTVITNKRYYTFALNAVRGAKLSSKDLTLRLQFTYPLTDIDLANIGSRYNNGFKPNEFTPNKVGPDEMNMDYSYGGDEDLKPKRVFDDGLFTYFEFEEGQKHPAIFAVDRKGQESIVNASRRGQYTVVESIEKQFTLREGEAATCIFNDGYELINNDPLVTRLNEIEANDSWFSFSKPKKTYN